MNIFRKVIKGAGVVVKAATPIALSVVSPESLMNVAFGGAVKHVIGNEKLNQQIPALSVAVSVLGRYVYESIEKDNWVAPIVPAIQEGMRQAGMGWAIHQSVKVPAMEWIKNPDIAAKIGPGKKASL